MPNMDEVVRRVKEHLEGPNLSSPLVKSYLRLLIEEREQKDAEIFNARSLRDFAVKKYNELEAKVAEQDKVLKDKGARQIAQLLEQVDKQDKEIQRQESKLKTYDFNLQTLLKEIQVAAEALRYVRDFPYLESTEDIRTIQRHVDGKLKKINQS